MLTFIIIMYLWAAATVFFAVWSATLFSQVWFALLLGVLWPAVLPTVLVLTGVEWLRKDY